MKSKSSAPGFLFLLLLMIFELISFESYSQDEIAQVSNDQETYTLKLPKANLKHPVNDTVLPTLCNSGKGLIHYEIISAKTCKSHGMGMMQDCKEPMVLFDESYTEEEFKALQDQKHLMEEQFLIEWRKQVKKDKMDIQLGEIIKGFYMQPPF